MVSAYLKSSRPGILYNSMALFAVALLFGGASRLDVAGPIIVRLVALGMIVWLIWTRHGTPLRIGRVPAILWAALFAIPLLQLLPLPWSIWSTLPGRDFARDVYQAMRETPWQPLSLTPDRTVNGLLALLPACAAYFLGTRADAAGRSNLIALVMIAATASALLGLLQVSSGAHSALYFYRITNADSSVGFFSNANHHSLFLCVGIVAAFAWLGERMADERQFPVAPALTAGLIVALLYASIAGTSSRAGAILSVLAFVGGLGLLPLRGARLKRWQIAAIGLGPLVLLCGALGLVLSGTVLEDHFKLTVEDDRLSRLPLFLRIVGDYFPIGSGMGSFDPVFRSYETLQTLNFGYLNNAHNDYAQIGIEAGLAGLVALILFLAWFAFCAFRIWRPGSAEPRVGRQQKAATVIIALLLAHSAVDYPLRTAALSVVFAFACAFLTEPSRSARSQHAARRRGA